MRSNKSVINIYKKQSIKSEVVTQLLYGDTFKKLKKVGSWIKIKNNIDNYKGYIKNNKFSSREKKISFEILFILIGDVGCKSTIIEASIWSRTFCDTETVVALSVASSDGLSKTSAPKSEDIDENRSHFRVVADYLQGSGHDFGVGPTTDI